MRWVETLRTARSELSNSEHHHRQAYHPFCEYNYTPLLTCYNLLLYHFFLTEQQCLLSFFDIATILYFKISFYISTFPTISSLNLSMKSEMSRNKSKFRRIITIIWKFQLNPTSTIHYILYRSFDLLYKTDCLYGDIVSKFRLFISEMSFVYISGFCWSHVKITTYVEFRETNENSTGYEVHETKMWSSDFCCYKNPSDWFSTVPWSSCLVKKNIYKDRNNIPLF